MISVDTETHLIRPGLMAPSLVSVAFMRSVDERPTLLLHSEAEEAIRWLLSQELTTANGVFDLGVFGAKWPDLVPVIFEGLIEGQYHDVQTRQKLIDIGLGRYRRVYKKVFGKLQKLGYSLEDLASRHLGCKLYKDTWRLRYQELENTPIAQWPQGAVDYACMDAAATLGVHFVQESESTINLHDEANQMRAHWALHLASCWGFHTDNKYVLKVISDIQKEQLLRRKRLIEWGLVRLDGSRDKKAALRRMWRVVGDYVDLKLTDKGLKLVRTKEMSKEQALDAGYIKLDAESCEETNDKVLIDYADYGQFQLLQSKIRALYCDVPIQTRFEVLLNTGRTSSSARTEEGSKKPVEGSAAIQNPPRAEGFRECFVPGRGMVLVACDFDIAELVSLSQVTYSLFGFSKMRDAINAGMDPHLDFASQMLGCSYEWALANKETEAVATARQRSKIWNFGKPGGLGDKSFVVYARGFGADLSLADVRLYSKAWEVKWPEMPLYFRYVSSLINRNGVVVQRDDGSEYKRASFEHVLTKFVRGGASYTEACNFGFQHLTAHAAKKAMFEVSRHCYAVPGSALYGSRIVNFVHDELILEVPEYCAHEAASFLEQVMVEEYQKCTPDVRIKASSTLMRRWRKKAKRKTRNGRLIPFEDVT